MDSHMDSFIGDDVIITMDCLVDNSIADSTIDDSIVHSHIDDSIFYSLISNPIVRSYMGNSIDDNSIIGDNSIIPQSYCRQFHYYDGFYRRQFHC
ncbi:unnamed protein product [Lasius platythorax]|uniref:Uncharacterized protein n=1 Tax=Lasius platythorax TaxID=488582 RepID=A0AAV2NH84_9HYME